MEIEEVYEVRKNGGAISRDKKSQSRPTLLRASRSILALEGPFRNLGEHRTRLMGRLGETNSWPRPILEASDELFGWVGWTCPTGYRTGSRYLGILIAGFDCT